MKLEQATSHKDINEQWPVETLCLNKMQYELEAAGPSKQPRLALSTVALFLSHFQWSNPLLYLWS